MARKTKAVRAKKVSPPEHPLTKHLASGGLFMGFWVTGVLAMMGASLLQIYFGAFISGLSCLLLLVWYGPHFKVAFKKTGQTPNSLSKRELTVVAIGLLISVIVPIFFWFSKPDWFGPKSRLVITASHLNACQNGIPCAAKVTLVSNGQLAAKGWTEAHHGFVSDHILSVDEEDNKIGELMREELIPRWPTRSETQQMQPGVDRDVEFGIDNSSFDSGKFQHHQQYVYVFAIVAYDDDYLPAPNYRVIEFCRYFFALDGSTNCTGHDGNSYIHN
jgi:hypothetical protein